MSSRLVIFLALAAVGCASATAQRSSQGSQPQGQQRGQQEGPKPYRDVITDKAVSDTGVFLVHRIDEKLYYEIPRAMLGREFRLVADQRGTTRGVRYAGEQVTARVVRWERINNKVLLRLVNYEMRADSTSPVQRAVDLSNLAPVIMAFDVAAWSPSDSNAVIETTKLFTTDVQELNLRQSNVRVRRFDPDRSLIERARAFPTNIEVSALHTFEVDSVPRGPGRGADRSLRSLTMLMNYSMLLLPATPMRPRLCDNRVGFFSVRFEDYGAAEEEARVPTRCYITRWRLEPKNPTAAVSDPVKPIVYYIDPATPAKWVPWIIRGVEMWEPVFREAGFSNAITARPAPIDDPTFDLDDMRYSAIRWLPSTVRNAYGPHVNDPRSGEILQSNIGWFQNVSALVESWYWVQAGAVDSRARTLPLPDSVLGEAIAFVSAHEVGHTLGLPHNQLSSGYYPVDSLRSPTYTRANGTSYSIMDYARNNYVAQPGDDVQLSPKIGPWDYYAIEWGYGRVPNAGSPEAERAYLDSLAREQDDKPWLRFGNPDGVDPRTQTEALGDDPVKASTYGLANIKRLVPALLPAATTHRMRDYDLLDQLYGELIAQWAREMGHVAVVVGGVYRHEKYPNQRGVIHTPVPRGRQAEAVRFLNANVFATPTFFFDAQVLRRIEPTGFVERIKDRQEAILGTLFQDARLSRLVEQEATQPEGEAYTIVDLFGGVRHAIFSELEQRAPVVDPYRRNLQRAFVEQMDRLINTPLEPRGGGTPRPGDARAVARLELQEIAERVGAVLPRATDRVTRAHLVDLEARIGRVLDPGDE
jgi:hypothetical protein